NSNYHGLQRTGSSALAGHLTPAPEERAYRDCPQASTRGYQTHRGAPPHGHRKPQKHPVINHRWLKSHPYVVAHYAPTQARSQSFPEWASLIAWIWGQQTDENLKAAPLVREVLCSCETHALLGSNVLIAQL